MRSEQPEARIPARAGQALYRMRRRIATAAVVVAALFFGYHAIFGENGVNVYEQRRAQDAATRRHIAELQQENARLQQQVKALKTDPDAIEHEARERLHYARPGEVIWTEDQPASTDPGQKPQRK